MKHLVTIILVYSCFFGNAKNVGLVIGESKYDKFATDWQNLSSNLDVGIMRIALNQIGFESDNIHAYEDLTYKEINDAFAFILEELEAGDHFHFHFSGHGQQMIDNNGDEIDGFDEALIPVDAYSKNIEGVYDGSKHLRDDNINEWLDKVRIKIGLGGLVSVTIDACHSGSSTRAIYKATHRGASSIFGYEEMGYTKPDDEAFFELNAVDETDNQKCPIVCLYGSGPNQKNYELRLQNNISVGSLTYAFYQALQNTQTNISYADLYEKIKIIFVQNNLKQNPQIEGEADRLLNNKGVKDEFVATVENQLVDVKINKGNLSGFFAGAKVSVFKDSITKYSGIVSESTPFSSTINLDNLPQNVGIVGWQCKLVDPEYNSIYVDIDLQKGAASNSLREKLANINYVEFNDSLAHLRFRQEDDNKIKIYNSRGEHLKTVSMNDSQYDKWGEVVYYIKGYYRFLYLTKIESNNNMQLDFDFVKVNVKKISNKFKIDELGNEIIKDLVQGDSFVLRITNRSSQKMYYSLLELQSNFEYGILIPNLNEERSADEYAIQPGQTILLRNQIFEVYPPFGKDVFMLVASQKPLNFVDILKPYAVRAAASAGLSDIEQMLSDGINGNVKSSGTSKGFKRKKNNKFIVVKKVYHLKERIK